MIAEAVSSEIEGMGMSSVDGRCIERAPAVLRNETAQALKYVSVQLAALGRQRDTLASPQLDRL